MTTNDSTSIEFVQEAIGNNKVVIFSKTFCPYCKMAKKFEKLSAPTHVIELDTRSDMAELQDALAEMTGAKTVPRCFVDGKFIGGGTDVKKMYDDGTLQKLLVQL